MKINFILPLFPRVPSGGPKIMYEYANRLADKGFDVQVYSCLKTPHMGYSKIKPFAIRKLISFIKDRNRPKPKWFNFNNKVKFNFINSINNSSVRNADATVVTWWALVEPLSKLESSKGKKINIIQDYEIWTGYKNLVDRSFQFENVINVAISHYVFNIVKKFDQMVVLIPNAVDAAVFYPINSISQRPVKSILMLYSIEKRKASNVGLQAVLKLKEKMPDVSVTFFGVAPRDLKIPSWIKYLEAPSDLNLIYNQNRIFISNSLIEGWGLPLHEAMQCGCAVICTQIEGHKQFIQGNERIITYEPRNDEDLFQKLLILCQEDDQTFERISEANRNQVKHYSWEVAVRQLISLFE